MSVILMIDLDMIKELDAAKQVTWKNLLSETNYTSKRLTYVVLEGYPRSFICKLL